MWKWKEWKNPSLLLAGIGVSNLGAWIYLIALNLIVLEKTGSPFAVSVLYILVPTAAICTNFWAGSIVDRLNKRHLMILLDITRAMLLFILPFIDSLIFMYLLVLVINIASSIFEPASMVYMTKLMPKEKRQQFNALRNFIQSSGFVLGPSIAGLLFVFGSPNAAIQINAAALCFSAIIIYFLPDLEGNGLRNGEEPLPAKWKIDTIKNDWKEILRFSKMNTYIALLYINFSGMMVFMTALDSLEAVFAIQVLSLSENAYGFLVSIAGAGIIAGSLTNAVFANQLRINMLIGFGAIFTAAGYLIFAFSTTYVTALIGFFLLTFALSFADTGFLTFYQNNVPVSIMGRFSSIFGILEAILIIIFTTAAGIAAEIYEVRVVYIAGSAMFLILCIFLYRVVLDKTKNRYYHADKEEVVTIKGESC